MLKRYCAKHGFEGQDYCPGCFPEPPPAPRASRAPDPAFVEAARRKFDPETEEEREAFWQKLGAVREGGRR